MKKKKGIVFVKCSPENENIKQNLKSNIQRNYHYRDYQKQLRQLLSFKEFKIKILT